MEQYFVELSRRLEGYEDFEKESYAFKVGRLMDLYCSSAASSLNTHFSTIDWPLKSVLKMAGK